MKRETNQRNAIRKVLLKAGRPLSIDEIYKSAGKKAVGLGIATVYRNVKSLLEENWIIQVDLPGQPSRWELSPQAHHHHFLCRTCDKLFEINDCPQDLTRLLPDGYTLEEHDILLRGQCDLCNGSSNRNNRK